MAAFRNSLAFRPSRNSTAPSFNVGSTTVFASTTNTFESTGVREWLSPNRAARFSEAAGIDYYLRLGGSGVTVSSTNGMLMLGGTVEVFSIEGGNTHFATLSVSTSTGAVINVTLGHGG